MYSKSFGNTLLNVHIIQNNIYLLHREKQLTLLHIHYRFIKYLITSYYHLTVIIISDCFQTF